MHDTSYQSILFFKNSFQNHTLYFWRTYSGQEFDLLEEWNGQMQGFECKWNTKKKFKIPRVFEERYSGVPVHFVTPRCVEDFLWEDDKLLVFEKSLEKALS